MKKKQGRRINNQTKMKTWNQKTARLEIEKPDSAANNIAIVCKVFLNL
jgi:hypothetical protein